MNRPRTETVELDADLARRARREAERRGITLRQLAEDLIRRELADEPQQPPFSLIGVFNSGRSDLSKLASEGRFEPEPFR
jgi:cytidylate kinase